MNIVKKEFGITKTGEKAHRFVMTNDNGTCVEVSDFGALILKILVPDNKGTNKDVVLGFETLDDYYNNAPGFGAYVGRNGNRIKDAEVIIEGKKYQLDKNDNMNNLHSGIKRSYYEFYEAETGENEGGCFVKLKRVSPHLEQGFPGNLEQVITYTLTNDNELMIDYDMISDMTTVVNPTNHSYFNLNGHDSGSILEHIMEIYSDAFLETDEYLIPTGELINVDGTPFDFRVGKRIGKDIDADYEPLNIAGGYDHNFVFANDKVLKKVASIQGNESGIVMGVYTDLCGMQVYTANFLEREIGKDAVVYNRRGGVCFETQFYPNACNEPKFPSSILPANKKFNSRTIYKFGIIE